MRQGLSAKTVASLAVHVSAWLWLAFPLQLIAQQEIPPANIVPGTNACIQPVPILPPAPTDPGLHPFPINLPTALQLSQTRALDIAAASARIRVAAALLNQADVLWLPTIAFGGDYFRHDGRNQDATTGVIFDNDRSTLMFGVGSPLSSSASLVLADAIFAPLAARQNVRAREADLQATANDTLLSVGEAYFTVQQARGELAGDLDASRRMQELVRRIGGLAEGLVPPLEVVRAKTELSRRLQAERLSRQRWRVASARLLQLLHLDPAVQVVPIEPPNLYVPLLDLNRPLEDFIAKGLLNRPELASQQAQIQAYLIQLKQERWRPFIPIVAVRGASTSPAGTLAAGVYGSGVNSTLGNYGARFDADIQVLWQLDNLGFGNVAKVKQRKAESELAEVDLDRTRDLVAFEISQALADAQLAAERLPLSQDGLHLAIDSAEKNLAGLSQTKRAGELVLLVVRPQEAVASIQALSAAYADYFGAIADANRAQLRLYRALGNPAQAVLDGSLCQPTPPQLPPPQAATSSSPLQSASAPANEQKPH